MLRVRHVKSQYHGAQARDQLRVQSLDISMNGAQSAEFYSIYLISRFVELDLMPVTYQDSGHLAKTEIWMGNDQHRLRKEQDAPNVIRKGDKRDIL